MNSLRRNRHLITRAGGSALAAFALLLAGAVAGAPAKKPAKKPHSAPKAKLWATVNVCDSADHPNTIGIRASMPGNGDRRQRMFIRIQVQHFTEADGHWHSIAAADSGFVGLGSAKARSRQAGRNFELQSPAAGATLTLRGHVTFQWRRGTKVLRRAQRNTSAGHPGTAGADPASFSAATCEIG